MNKKDKPLSNGAKMKDSTLGDEMRDAVWIEERKNILLELAKDITKVREKDDLLLFVKQRLKDLYTFTHTIVTLIDRAEETYKPFLLDKEGSPIRDHEKYDQLVQTNFSLDDPFIQKVIAANGAVSFTIKEIKDNPKSPLFLQVNYEGGSREILMTTLWNAGMPLGFIHMYSNTEHGFSAEFQNIISSISPMLSIAVCNIIKNEELQNQEAEKSFLLDFSSDIAAVRNKEELEIAVRTALKKNYLIRSYAIRKIDEDTDTTSIYLYDNTMTSIDADPLMKEVVDGKFPINDGLQNRVLDSYIPLLFNINIEINRGIEAKYLLFWKKMKYDWVVGTALRNGDINLGILWLAMEEINISLLQGICAQISTAMANIMAHDQILLYKQQLEKENVYLKEQITNIYCFNEIIGSAHQMQKVYNLMSLVAESNSTVLVLGETGTGKELIARAIHNASPRKDKLMIKVNCAAMPANLIESELFGHEKGAFTGAIERRIGKFELAHHSTLFLDEIGEMPLEAQVKLLRVLQEKELERVGGKDTIKVDVRIVAATNRDLEEEVKAGRFRSDLFYRLNVFPIHLPPLRERMEDIEPLANFFIAKYNKNTGKRITSISSKAIQQLYSYQWPGNVRELEHLIERSVLMATDDTLREVYLPKKSEHSTIDDTFGKSLEEMERTYIIAALRRCRGKISGPGSAAEALNVPGNTLHSKMKKLDISKADYFS